MIDSNGSSSSHDFTNDFDQKITGKDASQYLAVSVTGDWTKTNNSDKVTCTIIKNGKQISHKEATGSAGSVYCTTND